MGTFRSLFAELPCERCGVMRRGEVQFKTDEDRQQRYSVGDRVDDLPPDAEYPGWMIRYCDRCMDDYHLAENNARHAVMAAYVEDGRLTIADPVSGVAMTPHEIHMRRDFQSVMLKRAAIERATVPSDRWPMGTHKVIWDGEVLDRQKLTSPAQFGFMIACRGAVDMWMLEHGWNDGSDYLREDIIVRIDEKRIIGYQLAED